VCRTYSEDRSLFAHDEAADRFHDDAEVVVVLHDLLRYGYQCNCFPIISKFMRRWRRCLHSLVVGFSDLWIRDYGCWGLYPL
jgi:hypothetical protein